MEKFKSFMRMSFVKGLGLVLGLFLFVVSAEAKMMNGKVASYDPTTKKLTLETTDAVSGKTTESEMWTDQLEDLKPGEQVWVEAEQDPEGNWKVSKVTKA